MQCIYASGLLTQLLDYYITIVGIIILKLRYPDDKTAEWFVSKPGRSIIQQVNNEIGIYFPVPTLTNRYIYIYIYITLTLYLLN